jgi:hypothetical protein
VVTRFVGWLRSLRLWFVRQRNLRAQVVAAEHQVAEQQVEHWFAMQELVAGHNDEVARLRSELGVMRAECERWKAMYDEEVERVSAAVRD